jgi:hypothetical protein
MTPNIKKPKSSIFKEPNTVSDYYGKDIPGAFKLNELGTDRFTLHVQQTTDWDKIDVKYHWNSLGLRGPEPDYASDTRILFAGGSLCIGVGLPLEHTFPYVVSQLMNASYINLSDVDCLTDLIPLMKQFKSFNPTHVIVSDTRFIQPYGFAINALSRNHLTKIYEKNNEYSELFLSCDSSALTMFDLSLKTLFPNARLILAKGQRRLFNHAIPEFDYLEVVSMEKTDAVDLARDNAHPGIITTRTFAERIVNHITTRHN